MSTHRLRPGRLAELDEQSILWLRRVFKAVHQVPWRACSASQEQPAQVILRTLVTYCYARGLYRSSEIELAAPQNPAIRYLCGKRPPLAQEIRTFRRANKKSLRQALSRLFSPADAETRLLEAIKADSEDLDL